MKAFYKGLTQKEAAAKLNYNSQQQYSKLENGQTHFTDELKNKICEKFAVSPEAFTNGTQHNHGINDLNVLQELLQSQKETIKSKDKLIEKLEQENQELKQEIEQLRTAN
ncbi:MAG: helix-turn-helix domain-containing protein [Bacteroidetes bacterium]|nr:helix-turn-helix domain-containing protein [Bacteroidota bacterium]